MKKEPKTVGQRIRSLRDDLTQEEFANMNGIKQAMVSRYEADKETPSPRTLLAIARNNGKTIEWMLTGQHPADQANQVTKEELFSSAAKDLINTQDPAAKDFVEMMNDLFKNRRRMEKVFDFYRFIKKED
jgi:transcriptional regulator with XRE-family HTH domain